jgi:UDP-N-acetylglucosamine 3-dehydrogenase
VLLIMSRLNIAVIGAGYWGKKVIAQILDLARTGDEMNLYSVADSSPIALEQCRKEFGPLNYRLDYRELLSDPKLSAVHICSPNQSHFEIASEFLRQGKHVLVEKPLAMKSREAFELVRLAKEQGRILSTGHVHRFNNGVRSLRRLMISGVLGDLYYLRLRWTGFMAIQNNREVITDLGPHPFDICNNLLETWPKKISCKGRGYRSSAGYEMASIYAEHPGGYDAGIELSWLDMEKRRDVTVVGSDGSAELDCIEQRLVLHRKGAVERVMVVPNNTLREEILHFARCVEYNSSSENYPNRADGTLGANVVRVLETTKRSLLEERTVQVDIPRGETVPASEPLPGIQATPPSMGSI